MNRAINIIGILAGVIFILFANLSFVNEFVSSLLMALGTGLFAACFVNIILQVCKEKEPEEPMKLLTNERIDLTKFYRKSRSRVRHHHDLLSIAVAGALKDISKDDHLLDRILRDRLKVRLLFLNPLSGFVRQRAAEDQMTVADVYKELSASIALAVEIGGKLKARYAELKKSKLLNEADEGSFEVRLYDGCPYLTIFRADDEIVWGLYTAEKRGVNSAAFRSKKGDSALSGQLEGHFNVIWERSRSACIVRYLEQNAPVVFDGFVEHLNAEIARLSSQN